jgi:hypothetical protein
MHGPWLRCRQPGSEIFALPKRHRQMI